MNPGTTGLNRGLDILDALADEAAARDGLGVLQLTEIIGSEKSQVSRTLQVLEERGFVRRDARTLAYSIGWRIFALATRVGETELLSHAPPVMRALVRELGESVHLSVLQGAHVLTLLSESPESTLHAPGRIGGLTPVATTSAGRVLAMDFDHSELVTIGLQNVLPAIERTRERGYSIVREEFEPGVVAAAAPIRDAAGRVAAALNVSAPRFRFDDRLDASALRVVEAADELSMAIGGRDPRSIPRFASRG